MASVEYLIKQFLSPDKKVLDLSNQVLGDKGAMALAKSKHLKRVVRLTLANNNIVTRVRLPSLTQRNSRN